MTNKIICYVRGVEIEDKIKSSLKKSRLSKQKLQEAKEFVENLIRSQKQK